MSSYAWGLGQPAPVINDIKYTYTTNSHKYGHTTDINALRTHTRKDIHTDNPSTVVACIMPREKKKDRKY